MYVLIYLGWEEGQNLIIPAFFLKRIKVFDKWVSTYVVRKL